MKERPEDGEKGKDEVRTGSPRAWLLASRPKTLSGAMVPVMLGGSLAYRTIGDGLDWRLLALCFLFAGLMQIAANLINDLLDYLKGSDREDRLGPERACQKGWITAQSMKKGIAAVLLLAALIGLAMFLTSMHRMPFRGMELVMTGILCFLFCFLYTTHLSYLGLGDVLVVIFFGLVPVSMTCFVQTASMDAGSLVLGLIAGLMTDTILITNNIRDINEDRISGKRTLIVRIGLRGGQTAYLLTGLAGVMLTVPLVLKGQMSPQWAVPADIIYLILHILSWRKLVHIREGRRLNVILQESSRNLVVAGLLLSLAMVL